MTTTDAVPIEPASPATTEPKGWWSIERVVAAATPFFAAAGGYLFTVLGKVIPGVDLPRNDFVDLFIAGGALATTAALTWLYGRQKFVNFVQGTEHVADHVGKAIQQNFPQGVPQLRQIQAALEAHEAAVVHNVSQSIGLPPSAEDVAKEIVGQLWPQHAPPPPVQQSPLVEPAPVTSDSAPAASPTTIVGSPGLTSG